MVVVGLWLFSILFILVSRPFDCAEMPNGFLIGRATVFSSMIHSEDGLPDIAIRHPDGRLFSRGDISVHFWDEDGFGGTFARQTRDGGLDYQGRFIFLNGVGLIEEDKEPDRYGSDFKIKKREWEEKGRIGANLYYVYAQLMEDPESRRYWCKTDWFLPDETR